jgi:DNA-binding transcriptional LysR family regulator
MELRTLRTFVAVAELRSFSEAARRLHTVQPAISRQIAELEEELGTALLWRSTREVRVTAAGEVLLEDARRLLALESEAHDRVTRAAKGQTGQLRIGYMSSATARFMPVLLRHFNQRHPDVHVELFEMTAQQQLEAFARHEIDLGLSRPLPDPAPLGLEKLLLYQDHLMAVLPHEHPLAKRKRLSLKELAREDFVLFVRGQASGLFDTIISACGEAGFSPRVVRQPTQMQTLLSQVASGMGGGDCAGLYSLPAKRRLCLYQASAGTARCCVGAALSCATAAADGQSLRRGNQPDARTDQSADGTRMTRPGSVLRFSGHWSGNYDRARELSHASSLD